MHDFTSKQKPAPHPAWRAPAGRASQRGLRVIPWEGHGGHSGAWLPNSGPPAKHAERTPGEERERRPEQM